MLMIGCSDECQAKDEGCTRLHLLLLMFDSHAFQILRLGTCCAPNNGSHIVTGKRILGEEFILPQLGFGREGGAPCAMQAGFRGAESGCLPGARLFTLFNVPKLCGEN